MFSQNGYAGTNIRELSASLGLVKSGVYKHYESKEAIWNALLDQIDREPDKTEDAIKQVEAFSRHFIRVYGGED